MDQRPGVWPASADIPGLVVLARPIGVGPEYHSTFFSPVTIGDLKLTNRIVMAPLTRSRSDDDGVPPDFAADYYAQRADAGLIITEATNISPQAVGYALTPGIWSDAQVAAWRPIVDAVHRRGGRFFLQLWHTGRISHPDLHGGELPVAPSAIKAEGPGLHQATA